MALPAIELRRLNTPTDLPHQGELRDAIGWTDANGENAVLFSSKIQEHDANGDARAFAWVNHHVTSGAETRLLRLVKDRVQACPNDVTLEFEPGALAVTDLDGDRLGEVTFAYWISCKGDVSPDGLKLFLLENGDKYVIRGHGHWADCDPDVASEDPACKDERTPGVALEQGPAVFREHLVATWERISAQTI